MLIANLHLGIPDIAMPDSAFTPEKVFYPYFQSLYNQKNYEAAYSAYKKWHQRIKKMTNDGQTKHFTIGQ